MRYPSGAPAASSPAEVVPVPNLKPLSFLATLLLFAVPSAVFSLSLLVALPFLVRHRVPSFTIFNLCFGVPLALMLIAAFVGYRLEGRPFTWSFIRDRFRLGKLSLSGWFWTIGLTVFVLVGPIPVGYLIDGFTGLRIFTWPGEFRQFETALQNVGPDFLGITLRGHWWVFFFYLAFLVVLNVFGEELWWRGYILPRQEKAHGRWTWVIHGILWSLFHIFYFQTVGDILPFLPITCSIAFVAQRVKSTWPGVIAHTVSNFVLPLSILMGVLGRKAG